MLISGLNLEMLLPPYEEFIEAERKKRIEEELQSEYILLQSLSRTSENEATEEIQRQYEEAKNILISAATKKCIEQGGTETDNDSINEIVDELIEQYKTGTLDEAVFNLIYEKYKNKSEKVKTEICKSLGIDTYEEIKSTCNPLVNAISTIIYLQSNTELGLNPHLRSKRLKLNKINRII